MVGTALVPAGISASQVDTGLVYPNGMPVIREVMEQNIAAATIMGVRQAVGGLVTPGLDPQGLASLLMEAIDGDPLSYMQLAEEIEEKEAQYLSVLGTRKRQVSQLDITVEAGAHDSEDKKISEAVQDELVDSGLVEGAIFDMLDAIGKGYSLTEIVWDLQGSHWGIDTLEFVDPRFIRFDRPTRRIPLLRGDGDGGIGFPLPPYKFAFLQIRAKSGLPVRGGLARPVAWAWMFKNFALKDWVQFCEVFGMPLRVGEFAPGASEADKDALLQAVSSVSSDAACIIPSNMKIIFQETGAKGSAGDVHGALCDYLDKQISKLVLGQTGTTDATAGQLGGRLDHTAVREDIERSDARALTVCINRDIVRPFVDLNWGPRDKYPFVRVGRSEPKNAALMIDAAVKLVPLGLKVAVQDMRSAVGFTEPQTGDEILVPPSAAAGGQAAAPSSIPTGDLTFDTTLNALRQRSDSALETRATLLARSLHADEAGRPKTTKDTPDAIERTAAHLASQWKEVMGPATDQILAAATRSKNFDEFLSAIRALYPSIDMTPLAKKLASYTFQAYAGGAVGHEVDNRPARELA